MKFFVAWIGIFIVAPAMAYNCLDFKVKPEIDIVKPEYVVKVEQPDQEMDLTTHGHVQSSFISQYHIAAESTFIKTGFCVALKRIDVTLGYNEFLVNIDKNYIPGTCAYDAVMAHEQKHIDTYLSVLDGFQADIKKAVTVAADSVMPVFVERSSEINGAIEQMYEDLYSHPDLVLLNQKIRAAEEIKNNQVDQNETGADLKKCFE